MPDLSKRPPPLPAALSPTAPPRVPSVDVIPAGQASAAELRAARARVARVAAWMDGGLGVPIPVLRRVGLDALLGLIPVVGDVLGVLVSLHIVVEARRLGVPTALQRKLIRNGVVDGLVGLVPVVGDTADFFFRGNKRNADLLLAHIDDRLGEHHPRHRHSPWWLWALFGVGVLVAGAWWWHTRH